MESQMRQGAIAGIISLILLIPGLVLAYLSGLDKPNPAILMGYFVVIVLGTILSIIFINGIIGLSNKYNSNLLRITCYFSISHTVLEGIKNTVDIISPFSAGISILFLIITSVLFGIISIMFGIGLLEIKSHLGSIATATAILEIIAGVCFISVILSIPALLISVVTSILYVTILFQTSKLVKTTS